MSIFSNKNQSNLLSKFRTSIGKIQFSYLNVLNVGWEGGTVKLKNKEGDSLFVNISRAGGMAVVVGELPSALVNYGRESKIKIRVCSVAPYIGGAMRDNSLSSLVKTGYMKKITDVETVYSGEVYNVEVYEGESDFGKQYLLKSDAWAGKFGGNMSPYILSLIGREEKERLERDFISNTPHSINFMEERAYIVFSQAAAKLYDITDSNVAILHDYHSSLALFYNDDINPVIIGHNLAYQGIMGINSKKINNLKRKNIHSIATKDLSKRLNLSEQIIDKYFKAWVTNDYVGTGNILQAVIRKSKEKNGISATTVSPGYVKELKESYQDIKNRIIESYPIRLPEDHFDVGPTRKRIKDFYLRHFDFMINDEEADRFLLCEESRGLEELRNANIIGILNGLDTDKHASKHWMLKQIILNPYDFEWNNLQTPAYLKNVIS
ncbi:MAG: glycogen/starch synthase [bacterium]